MKTFILIALALICAPRARAGAFDELLSGADGSEAAVVPAPAAAEPQLKAAAPSAIAPCPAGLKGDSSAACFIKTAKTTVCADGARISAARVTEKDVASGKFGRSDLGKYKDADLREWAEHQKKLGRDSRWGDGSHQNILATGKVNPIRTAYVVLPNRQWLGRAVTVCLASTGACTEAQALEVGPNSTFRDHSEVSVRTLMDLGLDANPDNGTYYGEMTFTFH